MILATKAPARVAGVFFFACNMDPSGTKEFVFINSVGLLYKTPLARVYLVSEPLSLVSALIEKG